MGAPRVNVIFWMTVCAGSATAGGSWLLGVEHEGRVSSGYTPGSSRREAFIQMGSRSPREHGPALSEELTHCCVLSAEKMYSPKARGLKHKKFYDDLVPVTDATTRNKTNLYKLLSSVPLMEGLSDAAKRVCKRLHHAGSRAPPACTEAPASPPCEGIRKGDAASYLSQLEQSIGSAPIDHAAPCGLIHSAAVLLYDLMALLELFGIRSPGSPIPSMSPREVFSRFFVHPFQDTETQGPSGQTGAKSAPGKGFLASLRRGRKDSTSSKTSTRTASRWSLRRKKSSFVALFKRRSRAKTSPSTPPVLSPIRVRPADTGIVHSGATREAFYLGSRNPAVSLLFNLLFQAWHRRQELFESSGRPSRLFPDVAHMLMASSQQRETMLGALCGFALGSLLSKPPFPKTMWAAPFEFWQSPSRVVGAVKISCDSIKFTLRALDLAETAGVKIVNDLIAGLPRAERSRAVPLERNVTASTNLRRMCSAFGRNSDEFLSFPFVKCSLQETVLAEEPMPSFAEALSQHRPAEPHGHTQSSEGAPPGGEGEHRELSSASLGQLSSSVGPSRKGDATVGSAVIDGLNEATGSHVKANSLLESNLRRPPGHKAAGMEAGARATAQAFFKWLKLRCGGGLNAAFIASVFSLDLGAWWNLLLDYDLRSLEVMESAVKKATGACKKALGRRAPDKKLEAECTANPVLSVWKKKCSTKVAAFVCKYYGELYSSLPLENLSEVLRTAAALDAGAKQPRDKKGRPYTVLAGGPGSLHVAEEANAYSNTFLRLYQYCTLSSLNNKDLLKGKDVLSEWSVFFVLRQVGTGTRRWLSSFLPRSLKHLRNWILKKGFTPAMTAFLTDHLSARAAEIALTAIHVVVHPAAFLLVNQRSYNFSQPTGRPQDEGGFAAQMDNEIKTWATQGISETFLEQLRRGAPLKPSDLAGVDILNAPIPKTESFWAVTKATLLRYLNIIMHQPQSRAAMRAGCLLPSYSPAALAALADSLMSLRKIPPRDLHIVGVVVDPAMASTWRPGVLSRVWTGAKRFVKAVLRLPPWRAKHMVYTGLTIDAVAVSRLVEELATLYSRSKDVFKSQPAFKEAVYRWFESLQQHFQESNRVVLSLPQTNLLPIINPRYPLMSPKEKHQEFQESALQFFFLDIWMLLFSLSIGNFLDAEQMQRVEAQFSGPSWTKSTTDPLAVNSFRMVLFGSDFPLMLYDQLLPAEQKQSLKRTAYGAATAFSQQTLLTGKLYLAQRRPSLGVFLQAQGPFFGHMILLWQRKRVLDRRREILSWVLLALFIAGAVFGSVVQTSQVVETTVQNQASLAGPTSGCPPMGICLDGTIGDVTASPPAAAISAVAKTTLLVGIGSLLGPLLALWGIATSHFKVLSRLEMALRNTCSRLARWFRKKWKGRWFAMKNNIFVYKAQKRTNSKLERGRASLIRKKAPDLVDQPETQQEGPA